VFLNLSLHNPFRLLASLYTLSGGNRMEVDTTAQTAGQTVLAAEKGMDAMINELGEVLAQLEDQPENVPLLRRQTHLMQQLGMASEAIDCVLRLSTLVMLSEGKCLLNKVLLIGRHLAQLFRRSYPIFPSTSHPGTFRRDPREVRSGGARLLV